MLPVSNRTKSPENRPDRGRVLVLLMVLVSLSGCVRRRMTVRSNPPGAMVYIDDQQIGTTPVSTDFVYYGTRKMKLVKDQFETLSTYHTVAPPWYQIPPFDFITENLMGREIRDERVVNFNMVPQRVVPTQELLSRADNLRNSSQMGFAVPLPGQVLPASAQVPLPQTAPPVPWPTGPNVGP